MRSPLIAIGMCILAVTSCTSTAGPTDPAPVRTVGSTNPPAVTSAPRPVPTTTATTTTTTTMPPPPPASPTAWPPAPQTGELPPPGTTGIAVIGAGGAVLSGQPGEPGFVRAREGLVLAVEGRSGAWLEVRTPCDTIVWVDGRTVAFTPTRPGSDRGRPDDLADAVVVLDPGHGGPNRGATGPGGLSEPAVNLDIARRAADLLRAPHSVDWTSGVIGTGQGTSAVGTVWLTRTAGPEDADYEAGLLFRTRVADMAGADALISIHNNADPDGPYDGPGSEVFYSVTNDESRRLAGILMEEFRRSFSTFDVDWVGDTDAGAKYRLRSDGTTDYYGILRNATVPAVITEGAYISNPAEEALLGTVEFRQAYAEAIYRGLIRFLTTPDPGSFFTEPYERFVEAGRGDPLPTCQVPAQP